MKRSILGTNWRQLWAAPVVMPVFDFDTYAGGVKIDKRGGGMQSVVLHLEEKDGWREYRFRSVNKYPMQALTNELEGTLVGRVIQDQVSTLFPAAPLLLPPLLEAIGVLHVAPELYYMPDDERLGEHRAAVAGLVGTVELKGEEGPDDAPGFAGSTKIKSTEGLFEDLLESREHRADERELLAARLVDFLVNDSDRTRDNFDWARFGEKGDYRWRPLPRDRDYAFMDARGLLNRFVIRPAYPKLIALEPEFSLTGLTYSSFPIDRRLLQRLTREDFRTTALRVSSAISNDVIENVIRALPGEWRGDTNVANRLRHVLRTRRDSLTQVADQFYLLLAREPDIHATNENEHAEVMRHADGSVTVTITGIETEPLLVALANRGVTAGVGAADASGATPRTPYFRRTFAPGETREIRVYLHSGNDRAVVRGETPESGIVVRVIGGKGDDVLADSSAAATHFYDDAGDNLFVTSRGTHVSRRPFTAAKVAHGLRIFSPWRPDWGGGRGFAPAVGYGEGAGLIVGMRAGAHAYGFRRLPHHWRAGATLLVGTGNGRMAITTDADYRLENSPLALTLDARASRLDAFRFYGYGNSSPAASRAASLVNQSLIAVEPALVWHLGYRARERDDDALLGDKPVIAGVRPLVGRMELGPVFYWSDPDPRERSPFTAVEGAGDSFSRLGARLGLSIDRTDRDPTPMRGWTLHTALEGYPSIVGLTESFGTASAAGTAYVPFSSDGPHMAMRLGASAASGGTPVQHAPAIGGSTSLRGYAWQRYRGDRSVDASAELRLPVGTLSFIVRSKVGLFALADGGRVWFDGASDGGWHTGFGGGVWAAAFGKAISIAYARGEEHRVYLRSGLSF